MFFSLLMSVYKKETPENLNNALFSVWDDQTLKPTEIVLVKDGPLTGALDAIISHWQDYLGDKLKVVGITENVGLGAALNEGLKQCSFDLVARMDSDDISLPERFQKQVLFMEKNPEVVVSSAYVEEFTEDSDTNSVRRLPLPHEEIKRLAKIRCPINHPAVIYRKGKILEVGGYPPLRKAQDIALWSLLLSRGSIFANIDTVLVKMRLGNDFYARRGSEHLKHELKVLRFQKKIGFINLYEFVRNIILRSFIRLMPNIIKRYLYKYARR